MLRRGSYYTFSRVQRKTVNNVADKGAKQLNYNNISIALCLVCKNEKGNDLIHAINHYLNIGFDKIIFYDGNDDNEQYECIKNIINSGHIIYHKCNDIKDNIKQNVFKECYEKYYSHFEWIAFFDCDEHLILNKHDNIKTYLSQSKFTTCNIIQIDRKTRIMSDGSVIAEYTNDTVKCIAHCSAMYEISHKYRYITNTLCAAKNCSKVNSSGGVAKNDGLTNNVFEEVYIEHMHSTSFNNFLDKLKKGNPKENRFNFVCLSYIESELNNYFKYVNFTDEHLKQINNVFPDFGITKETIFNVIDLSIKTNIDYVFPYVDDSDEVWYKEYCEYRGIVDYENDTISGAARYRTYDLLKYKLRGIEQNMPWIRNIYMIVASPSQVPEWLDTTKVKIVYHKDIIPEEFLPTFNSSTIEMFLGNIEGLGERFLYGNDDFYVLKPVMPYMFFRGEKPLLYLKERNIDNKNKLEVNYNADAFIKNDINIAKVGTIYNGIEKVFQPEHHIKPMLKSKIKEVVEKNKSVIYDGCTRFRDFNNFNQYVYHFYNVFNKNYISYVRKTYFFTFKGVIDKLVGNINNYSLVSIDFDVQLDANSYNIIDSHLYNKLPTKSYYEKHNIKVALCAIGKWEEQYLSEWVEHYKSIGFDNIIFYDNNDVGDDGQYMILKPYIDEGFVIYNDWKGKLGNATQKNAYEDCLKKYKKTYDWIAFFDCDEFLELVEHKTIKELIKSNENFNKFDGIMFNWLLMTDNDLVYNDSRPLKERFKTPFNVAKKILIFKTIINTHGNILEKVKTSHYPAVEREQLCTTEGQPFVLENRHIYSKKLLNKAYIKHYKNKTIEESINRVKRGDCNSRTHYNNKLLKERLLNEGVVFFCINKVTEEKIRVIMNAFPEYANDYLGEMVRKNKIDNNLYNRLRLG